MKTIKNTLQNITLVTVSIFAIVFNIGAWSSFVWFIIKLTGLDNIEIPYFMYQAYYAVSDIDYVGLFENSDFNNVLCVIFI